MHLCICKCKTAAWIETNCLEAILGTTTTTTRLGHRAHVHASLFAWPFEVRKMGKKKHVTLISDTLKKANHSNSFIWYIQYMSIYIYVSIQKERDGGGLDDQLPFGRGVYLSLLESIQDAVRMAELITDGTVIGQLCPQRRGWKGSHNFNSSKHLLVDHHYLLALGNGTVMKTVWNFPMAGENDDSPIWEWIVFPSYQNIKWVFPIFSYYPLE